jgi:tetratricopeptide (TPR) repeat protein/predicted Ser/Thr protein kinase/TolB-like protein
VLERLQQALGDRYRVEREVGAGGMATVFLATDRKHERSVAIKVLRPELAAALGHERFLREIEIAAKLQHPHILPVYDSGEAGGLLYYVMPFVEGESLRDRLVRGGPLAPQEAVRIAREAADALAYAHRQGIVHRDIKPANVLISQGHAVIADFGIARAVSASAATTGLTQAGMAIGTPSYMSPEQALGEANLDGRTDIYALGVMLYEMLCGNPPFEGTTPQAIIAQALSRDVPRLPADPLGLQPVIERALAKEPGDRFATADELSAALDGVATGVGFRVAGRRRTRGLVAAGAVVLAAILAVALWPRGFRAEGDPRRSLIVFPFDNKTGDPTRDYLEEAAMNLLGLAAAHWEDMRVYDDERTASLLRRRGVTSGADVDFEAARGMAREARVGTLVLGDVRREGDSLAIEAKVHDVRTGERLATHIVRAGWDADPRPLFDAIAGQVLGTSGAPPGERPSVLAQTTSSIEAYRAYLAGTSAMQRFQIDSAKALLGRAVALDSSFALAYLRLRDAEGWGGVGGSAALRRQYILAAERHSASLPPRLRALVDFHRAYEDGNLLRARRVAEGMIARDSTDVEAWYQLGEAHFHHGSSTVPHPDTLGNLGLALRAFERTLALDSSYVLAYQHILDALAACASSNVRVCLADSAAYGTPDELSRRYGDDALERMRGEAAAAQILTARGWITAVPGSPRPRVALVRALYGQARYSEVMAEIESAERLGWGVDVGAWKAMTLVLQGRPGAAATALDSALGAARDTFAVFQGLQNPGMLPGLLVGGGGRVQAGRRLNATLFRGIPVDSAPFTGGIQVAMSDLAQLTDRLLAAHAGTAIALDGAAAEVRAFLDRYAGRDSVRVRRVTTEFGSALLAFFVVGRDTALLAQLVADADTVISLTRRVASAHLALARGDTAAARASVDRYYRQPAPGEFIGESGLIRAFAWGDLLTRLNEPRAALEAYAHLDTSDQRVQHPGFVVRSWAERGALHQQLGETAEAIREYERFIAAWQYADPELQRLVERARAAVAALRGEIKTDEQGE